MENSIAQLIPGFKEADYIPAQMQKTHLQHNEISLFKAKNKAGSVGMTVNPVISKALQARKFVAIAMDDRHAPHLVFTSEQIGQGEPISTTGNNVSIHRKRIVQTLVETLGLEFETTRRYILTVTMPLSDIRHATVLKIIDHRKV